MRDFFCGADAPGTVAFWAATVFAAYMTNGANGVNGFDGRNGENGRCGVYGRNWRMWLIDRWLWLVLGIKLQEAGN